jgi:hypothetical protein
VQEFKLLIRNQPQAKDALSPEQHLAFVKACEAYIGRLKEAGKLIAAQPLQREGVMLSGKDGAWQQAPYAEGPDVIVGYYHIVAEDLAEAVSLAQGNPEFSFTSTARVEVRPIKGTERATGFVYPKA